MRIDTEFQKMLAEKAAYYQDTVPVFKIQQQNLTELHKAAVSLANRFTGNLSIKESRFSLQQKDRSTHILLPGGATMKYYHNSGNKQFSKNTNPFTDIISHDASKENTDAFKDSACDLIEKHQLNFSASMDEVHFEKLWQLKACGINQQKEKAPVIINRLVYSYRRFLTGLPVLGSASVYIKMAANNNLDAFGIDWRTVHDAPLDKAYVLSPEDGAKRALEELQNTNPEKIYTSKDFTIDSFTLGYFSDTKSNYQSIMQPVWVAKFISNAFSKMGHIIAVPASSTAYESINRKLAIPPLNELRRKLKTSERNCTCQPSIHKC